MDRDYKIVEDMFLTENFLIKGTVEGKFKRLSSFLDQYRKNFLPIRDATLIDLATRQRVETPLVFVRVNEIILAHEYLDVKGDWYLAQLAAGQKLVPLRAFHSGRINLELSGLARPQAYEIVTGSHHFFIIEAPKVVGLNTEGDPDLEQIAKLPYLIVNKHVLAYIYDFNVPEGVIATSEFDRLDEDEDDEPLGNDDFAG
ncbi:MAG: hypothetical protein H6834_17920 [Planctomycetes bacterium]|nr:hypothetical protein [Planctomycetota bacterium]MCB9890925.1 hypothetical protein [Planctomycetota bacterium]